MTVAFLIIDLTGYSNRLYEDNTMIRMHESLNLCNEILNMSSSQNWIFVKVFNKSDIFRERIKTVPITKCFPDYDGNFIFPKPKRKKKILKNFSQ